MNDRPEYEQVRDQTPEPEPVQRPQRRPVRRNWRRPVLLVVAWAVIVAAAFSVGLVVGRALEEAPKPGGEQTIVRTLVPGRVGPADTVTVTVTGP